MITNTPCFIEVSDDKTKLLLVNEVALPALSAPATARITTELDTKDPAFVNALADVGFAPQFGYSKLAAECSKLQGDVGRQAKTIELLRGQIKEGWARRDEQRKRIAELREQLARRDRQCSVQAQQLAAHRPHVLLTQAQSQLDSLINRVRQLYVQKPGMYKWLSNWVDRQLAGEKRTGEAANKGAPEVAQKNGDLVKLNPAAAWPYGELIKRAAPPVNFNGVGEGTKAVDAAGEAAKLRGEVAHLKLEVDKLLARLSGADIK